MNNLGISLTLFRIGSGTLFWFCPRMVRGPKRPPSSLKSVTHTLQWSNLAVILYLKKIRQKRFQQSATFVVIRNFLMPDLQNSIFKIAFSKIKCSQNYLEMSLPSWQSMFPILEGYILPLCGLSFEKQHGTRAQRLLKSEWQHIFHIYWSLWRQFSC